MSNWAPWLGPYTWQSEMALNREYEKCKPQCMPGTPNIEFSAEPKWELLEEERVWLSDDFQMKLKLHKSWYIAF